MGSFAVARKRIGLQGARVLALLALVLGSGVIIGLAVGLPLRYVKFSESDAQQLNQNSLAGKVDPKAALVTQDDLPAGWTPGDPALGGFGLLGQSFCGQAIKLPTPLSGAESAVFSNATDKAYMVSQAQRFDRASSAVDYVASVKKAVGACTSFYQGDPKAKFDIRSAAGTPPISDDYVSAAFVQADGSSTQEWSMMAVGDTVIVIQRSGPIRPPADFLNTVEKKVLARVDPDDFAPGGVSTESTIAGSTGGSDAVTTAPPTTQAGG